jgi:hypothetical protein
MQEEKLVKVRVKGFLAQELDRNAEAEDVTTAEIIRRAMSHYFLEMALICNVAGSKERPFSAPSAAPPSSPPPSSPPAPPLTPPSLSPPAPLVPPFGPAEPAEPAEIGEPSEPALSGPAIADLPVSDLPLPAPPGDSGFLFAEAGPAEPPAAPAPLLLFPCVADARSGRAAEWALTVELVAQWEETFPGMDVVGEARRAREWILANHRKTHGGMRSFLLRWLSKAQDSGRFMRRAAAARPAPGTGPRTVMDIYGFASWEEWEAVLREHFKGRELDQELGNLAKIRTRWEEKHG